MTLLYSSSFIQIKSYKPQVELIFYQVQCHVHVVYTSVFSVSGACLAGAQGTIVPCQDLLVPCQKVQGTGLSPAHHESGDKSPLSGHIQGTRVPCEISQGTVVSPAGKPLDMPMCLVCNYCYVFNFSKTWVARKSAPSIQFRVL